MSHKERDTRTIQELDDEIAKVEHNKKMAKRHRLPLTVLRYERDINILKWAIKERDSY